MNKLLTIKRNGIVLVTIRLLNGAFTIRSKSKLVRDGLDTYVKYGIDEIRNRGVDPLRIVAKPSDEKFLDRLGRFLYLSFDYTYKVEERTR